MKLFDFQIFKFSNIRIFERSNVRMTTEKLDVREKHQAIDHSEPSNPRCNESTFRREMRTL